MLRRRADQGQSILEYAVLFSIVLAAAVGMQTYMKRGMQGRYKAVTDELASKGPVGPQQYEPYYAESHFETETKQNSTEEYRGGGVVERNIVQDERTRKQGGFQQEGVQQDKGNIWDSNRTGGTNGGD